MEAVIFVVAMAVVVFANYKFTSDRKATGLCAYCDKQLFCDECGRCGSSKCNGGCIFCRKGIQTPFGIIG